MFKLIKNVDVYSPEYIGKNDILICHNKIVKIAPTIEFEDAEVNDYTGKIVIPGIIDQHVHITGGGGEGGFHTRTPEVVLSDLINGGVTSVVGLLGTDSLTRSIEDLLAKTKALKNEGMNAFCLTGAYTYPSPTITGDVRKDIAFIDEIIGLKLAISDHRESMINKDEFKKLVADVRVSSLVSGKPGIVTLHMGDDPARFNMILDVLEETSIPIKHFRPTHVARTDELFEDALIFLEQGGYIDLTVGIRLDRVYKNLVKIKERNLNLDHVTFSSDGNGSWSQYDENGNVVKMGAARCDAILNCMKHLVAKGMDIEDVIKFGTTNVARALELDHKKGYIKANFDADLLILDQDLNLDTVITRGKEMMYKGNIQVKGTYED
ncbi:beta-aspartyl-peptidase [Haloplasma contractile]|uniref:Isoaspartyl dipeptidase n=1 Tax=Haloplasma contractile SSD-17B TaxID=1033810 RepID=F7Q1N4_9MOLU|nr:beta-aspartyl-peptidase [Haloplasma contractile]ERJ12889.1 Isoaspartyl dipeptidase protein [Haloplasma contractile SSD-17B]